MKIAVNNPSAGEIKYPISVISSKLSSLNLVCILLNCPKGNGITSSSYLILKDSLSGLILVLSQSVSLSSPLDITTFKSFAFNLLVTDFNNVSFVKDLPYLSLPSLLVNVSSTNLSLNYCLKHFWFY
ncbi:hypothetical protein [Mycoplasma yeatsii]|uniref:hypothetical protein n=1 Tax=Mycoplasma yeatsii TaxID=51365 RepID=UPI0005B3B6CE|nr:hypothetical protein [Mycoplasma yeatsii]